MQNIIFSTASDSFLVKHVIHAGPVAEIPEKSRKGDNTHYFRMITTRGAVFCHFKSVETARRSRGVLGAMLGTVKPHLFRSKGDSIDIASIVSFGRVIQFKNYEEGDQYGFPVHVATVSDKSATIWLTYNTEESTKNVRKALYAAIMAFYNPSATTTQEPLESEEDNTEVSEVALAET